MGRSTAVTPASIRDGRKTRARRTGTSSESTWCRGPRELGLETGSWGLGARRRRSIKDLSIQFPASSPAASPPVPTHLRGASQLSAAQPPVQLQRVTDDRERFVSAKQVLDDDLLVLQHFVILEEAAELPEYVFRQIRSAAIVGEPGIADADRYDLVVDALLVAHSHHADGAGGHDRQRVHRLLSEHQRIERIAIVAIRAWNEAVVRRIVYGAVQHAVESQQSGLLVQLVLVRAAPWNLDDHREG